MKQVFFFIFVGLAIVSCGSSDTTAIKNAATATKDSTTIQWIDPIEQNVGKINQGEVIEILWHFKNSGSKPLVIANVRAGCGCTGAEGPKQPIAPGKEGTISAKFDSKNFSGSVRKQVYVTANITNKTSDTPEETLSFSVDITPQK